MAVRMFFEPKNPRIITSEDYYISDLEEEEEEEGILEEKPQKRKTGTQALVEFLNNTSPEEFQKNNTNRLKATSTSFFHRKKPLNKPSHHGLLPNRTKGNSPHLLLYRKNYIEILANPFMIKKERSSPPKSTPKSSGSSANLNRKLSAASSYASSYLQESINGELPHFRKGPDLLLQLPPKHLLLQNSTSFPTKPLSPKLAKKSSTLSHKKEYTSSSTGTGNTFTRQNNSYFDISKRAKRTSQDIIEQGLLQRLKLYRTDESEGSEKPSDFISRVLAQEHIQVLSASIKQQEKRYSNSTRVRHMQVQTMPTNEEKEASPIIKETEQSREDNVVRRLELLEQELKQEIIVRQRLEAALEDACDHFEVLSGIAYKKIRELWEDRSRWENACLQAKEQCWIQHQQHILGASTADKMESADHQINLDGT